MNLDFDAPLDLSYTLDERYTRTSGSVYLTGTQTLLRVTLDQRRRDIAADLNTAGFISGYRGSPLGAVDQEYARNKDWGRIAHAYPEKIAEIIGEPIILDETIEAVIARRSIFLEQYQNSAWAKTYEDQLAATIAKDGLLGLDDYPLTQAAAKSLFKVMSYKDEYEVARLHMQTDFIANLNKSFSGDFKVKYHLAPPMLPARLDGRGRPRKREFGSWIRVPMKVLAKMKVLRGTPFDPFGYMAERGMERDLITKCQATIEQATKAATSANAQKLSAIIGKFTEIRGYGPVKITAAEKVLIEIEEALDQFKLAK